MPPQLQELVANSTINVVEHIAHIADELHKAGLVKMSNRRNKKGLKAYLDTALESYTTELYPLAALYSLPRLTGKPTMDETLQVFNAVIDDLPKDLSPCLLKGNMQAILDIMLRHTCDEVDRADVAKFIAQYDPIRTKPKAISNKLKTLLTRKAKEAIQVFDPRTITFNVALLTTLQGKAA